MLKSPQPDFVLSPEHWLGRDAEFREKFWQVYRLVNPTSERQTGTPATRMGRRMHSEERPPETASGKTPQLQRRRRA